MVGEFVGAALGTSTPGHWCQTNEEKKKSKEVCVNESEGGKDVEGRMSDRLYILLLLLLLLNTYLQTTTIL